MKMAKIKQKWVLITACILAGMLFIAALFAVLYKDNSALKTQKLTDIEWYSETQKEFTITTAQEFYDLIVLSQHYTFKGQTVKLGADIVLNEGNAVDWKETAPKNKWTPIKQFAGTFDGQGHSISGVYLKKNSVIAGLFGTIEEGALIQDFKLVNSYIETNGRLGTGSVAGLSRDATLRRIYCDTILHLHGRYNGGLIGRIGGKTKVEECWFDGEMTARNYYSAGMVAQVGKGTLTMSNCLNTAKLIGLRKATQGLAGYVVAVGSNAKLILKDCLNAITIESKNIKEVASLLTLCAANARLEMENVISLDTGYSAICAVGNGAYTKGGVYQMAKEELLGTKAYEWTELDFDKYWVAVENDTPRLKYFSEEGMNLEGVTKAYDISWYDENAKEYLIDTKEKYYGFYIMSQLTDFAGKSVKLGSDLSFNSGKAEDWEEKSPDIITHPISHECYPFAGTFDGQGHTLSGLYAKGYFYIGMFAETSGDATVQNLNLHNSYFESLEETDRGSFIGSIAGYGGGTFDTIYSNAIVVGRDAGIGGIFGQVRLEDYAESFFMNCWYDGTIKLYNGWLAGGIVGDMRKGDVSISHCLNTGEIISQGTRTSVRCGGIMGNHMAKEKLLIEDCLNTGKVTANKYEFASSVLGYTYSGGKVEIKDTFTTPDSYIHPIWGVPIGVYDKGNVVKGGALHIDRENLIGKGGYEWTTLDFDKYWTIVSGGTPILQTWADKIPSVAGLQKAYDTSWYKEDEKTFVIKNKKQLIGFYLLAKVTNYSEKTIKLGADITLNSGDANEWGEHAPKIKWAPVGDPSMYGNFAGTFDGQGHTLSGIYAKREMRVGLFGQMNAKAVVKNLKIKNSYFESTENGTGKGSFVGSITGYAAGGKLEKIKSEAIVVGHDVAIGGLVGQSRLDKQVDKGTIINNCWFAGTVKVLGKNSMLAGGILGDKRTGEVTITNCLNTGHIVSESAKDTQRTGGLVGGIQSKGFVMKDCLNTGKITTKKYDGVGSVIGMVAKGTEGKIRNTYTTKESHVYKSLGVPMSIMDNSNSAKGGAYILPEAKLIGKGGYEWTELDFNKYWTTVENGTPILKSFAGNIQGVTSGPKAFDISWYKENEKTYSIKTKEQLYGLSMLSKIEDFEGKTIKLHSNITMNQGQNASDFSAVAPSESWTPIGDRYFQFKGTFDGQGHTISGLYAKEIRYAGLFGYTTEQVAIKDLILTNSYFESTATDRYGSFAGSVTGFAAGGIFENLKSDAIVVGNDIGIGGLIGQSRLDKQLSQGTIINNCWFAGTIEAGKNAMFAAGILGDKRSGETVITNCLNTGSIVSESEEATQRTGGLVGGIQSNSLCRV